MRGCRVLLKSCALRPLFMGAESCEKSQSFVATFGRKLPSTTLFVHARYGAMKVLWNAEACWFKIQKFRSPPREAKKSNTQPLSRTLNLARCTPRKAPIASHQRVWHSIWRYPTKRLCCQSNSPKTSWTHLRSSQTCSEVRRSVRLR